MKWKTFLQVYRSQLSVVHSDRIWQLAWNPMLKSFASCSSDKSVRLTNVETKQSAEIGTFSKTVRSVSFSHDGRFLAACGFDGCTKIWNLSSKPISELCSLEGHENEVKCVAWAPSYLIPSTTYLLATCGRDKTIWLWAIETDSSSCQEVLAVLQEHSQDVKSIVFHPRYPGLLVSASADESIKIWADTDDASNVGRGDGDWVCTASLHGHGGIVWQVAWMDSDLLVSVSEDGYFRIWGSDSLLASTWSCLREVPISSLPCYCISVNNHNSSGQTHIAVGSGDNSIKIFSIGTRPEYNPSTVLEISTAHSQDVNSLIWIGANAILSSSDDSSVKLWKLT